MNRLIQNDELVNLLYYTDKDPYEQPCLSPEEKRSEVFEKLIKIVPRVGPKETAQSLISLRVIEGTSNENDEFKNLRIGIEVFVPMTQWFIKDENSNLRPFAIMGAIEDSLKGKKVNGLGRLRSRGFSLNFLTEEISCYEMIFEITSYD